MGLGDSHLPRDVRDTSTAEVACFMRLRHVLTYYAADSQQSDEADIVIVLTKQADFEETAFRYR